MLDPRSPGRRNARSRYRQRSVPVQAVGVAARCARRPPTELGRGHWEDAPGASGAALPPSAATPARRPAAAISEPAVEQRARARDREHRRRPGSPTSTRSMVRGLMRCLVPQRRHANADRDDQLAAFHAVLVVARTGYGARRSSAAFMPMPSLIGRRRRTLDVRTIPHMSAQGNPLWYLDKRALEKNLYNTAHELRSPVLIVDDDKDVRSAWRSCWRGGLHRRRSATTAMRRCVHAGRPAPRGHPPGPDDAGDGRLGLSQRADARSGVRRACRW